MSRPVTPRVALLALGLLIAVSLLTPALAVLFPPSFKPANTFKYNALLNRRASLGGTLAVLA